MTDEPTPLQAKRLDRLADRIKQLPQHRQEQLMTGLQDNVFTVAEVAEGLDVTTETVRRWIRAGDLEAAKVSKGYRISRPALAEFWRDRGGGELFDKGEQMSDELEATITNWAISCASKAIQASDPPSTPREEDWDKLRKALGNNLTPEQVEIFESEFIETVRELTENS